MEHPADSNSTEVPTSYALAVPAHAPKPSSCHVPAPVHLEGDNKVIVLALRAPNNPNPGPFRLARQRRTFWTACTSCKEIEKYSIEYLNCNISCIHCSEAFKALEVTKPRDKKGASTTLSETRMEHGNPATTLASRNSPNFAPLRKKLKSGVSVLQSAMHDIKMVLKFKGKAVIDEKIKETMCAKNISEHLPEPTQDEGHQAET